MAREQGQQLKLLVKGKAPGPGPLCCARGLLGHTILPI